MPSDIEGAGRAVKRFHSEGRPVLIVFPDGETQLVAASQPRPVRLWLKGVLQRVRR